jgi:hypothetical protein
MPPSPPMCIAHCDLVHVGQHGVHKVRRRPHIRACGLCHGEVVFLSSGPAGWDPESKGTQWSNRNTNPTVTASCYGRCHLISNASRKAQATRAGLYVARDSEARELVTVPSLRSLENRDETRINSFDITMAVHSLPVPSRRSPSLPAGGTNVT